MNLFQVNITSAKCLAVDFMAETKSWQNILFFATNDQTDSQVGLRRLDHESNYTSVSIAKF
jgi:hypothetical protein